MIAPVKSMINGFLPPTPVSMAPRPDFSSGICSCFEDFETCILGCCCGGYLLCRQRAYIEGRREYQMNCLEVCCGVGLSLAGFYVLGALGIACWESCHRNSFRRAVGVAENPSFFSVMQSFFCYPCAICQQERELHWLDEQNKEYIVPSAPPAQKIIY